MSFIGSETTYGLFWTLIILTLPSLGLPRCIEDNSYPDAVPVPADEKEEIEAAASGRRSP